MARILKRPMFNRGGSTNNGIMTGLVDRKGYDEGTENPSIYETRVRDRSTEIQNILNSLSPVPKTKLPLGKIGAELALRGTPFKEALYKGYGSYVTADDKRKAALANREAQAVGLALGDVSKEMNLEKRLEAQKSLYNLKKKDQINAAIMLQSQTFLTENIYKSKAAADNHANWIYKKSTEYPQERIGGVLTKTQLADSKFPKKQGKKKGGVGTIYYDPFNDQVLEIARNIEGDYVFQIYGSGEKVVSTTPKVVKDKTFLENLTGEENKPYTYEDYVSDTGKTTKKLMDTITTPVDLQDIDTSNIRKYR